MTENLLIASLPRVERARLLALCDPVQLVPGEALCEPGDPTRFVYFPADGIVSLVTSIPGHQGLEVGMIGGEGMVGAHLLLGVACAPLRAQVQSAGTAMRIAAKPFCIELDRSPSLRRTLMRYLYVVMAQSATSAACLRFHALGPRLARFLLMTQDRAHADEFRLTHEFVSRMLGVRRVGITSAAVAMKESRLIEYRRGLLTILDRPGLEQAACSCYAADLKAYDEGI